MKITYGRKVSQRRQGMALVMVVCVMALAAVIAYAMVSSSALQATATSNGLNAAIADAQAESGLQLAMYYVLHPGTAPSTATAAGITYWPGGNNITFATSGSPASTMPGSANVTVAYQSSSVANRTVNFLVTSTGSSGVTSFGGGSISRTITGVIQVATAYQIKQAGTFNVAVTVPVLGTFRGSPYAIVSSQTVSIALGGTVDGGVSASGLGSILGTLIDLIGGTVQAPPSGQPAPIPGTSGNLHDYSTYTYGGNTYSAQTISSSSLSSLPAVLPSNPLGVYVYNGGSAQTPLNVTGTNTLNGTLIVKNAKLSMQGNLTITAASNMPALVIDQQLQMASSGKTLNVNGTVYAGGGVTGTALSLTDNLTINGALLINTGGITSYNGVLSVTYNASNTSVPDLSTANQVPQSVKILSWVQ